MKRVRPAMMGDLEAIRAVYQAAFDNNESELVGELAVRLLEEKSSPATVSLVAESDGSVVGHVAFSPVTIVGNQAIRASILAPLAVKPVDQGNGFGSRLIETGKQVLIESRIQVLFVYGDPAYYHRFGFDPELARRFDPPFELTHPIGWQACLLDDGELPETQHAITCVPALSDPKLW